MSPEPYTQRKHFFVSFFELFIFIHGFFQCPILVRAGEFALARRVRQSRPASIFLFFLAPPEIGSRRYDRSDPGPHSLLSCTPENLTSLDGFGKTSSRQFFFVLSEIGWTRVIRYTEQGRTATIPMQCSCSNASDSALLRPAPSTDNKVTEMSVPVATLPRLLRSCARGILGGLLSASMSAERPLRLRGTHLTQIFLFAFGDRASLPLFVQLQGTNVVQISLFAHCDQASVLLIRLPARNQCDPEFLFAFFASEHQSVRLRGTISNAAIIFEPDPGRN